jgi:subtilisin family serine protease
MPRLTHLLEKIMYRRAVTPILVETTRLADLKAEIAQVLPSELKFLFPTLPRINREETAFAPLNEIPFFNMLSFPATSLIIEELAQDKRIERLYYDRMVWALQKASDVLYDAMTRKKFVSTHATKHLIGADQANAEGWTGNNVNVAIIDSGSAVTHEQLPHVQHYTAMKGLYTDGNGHGTHVTSIIGGKSIKDPWFNVQVEGMVSQATLLNIKALGYVIGVGKDSDILTALALSQKLGAHIVNMSLGTEMVQALADDPEATAITKLTTDYNMIVCCAAGNSGPDPATINSPGITPKALTVGALDEIETGDVAEFSSRGALEDVQIKPDVIAPGKSIYSACINLLDIQGDKKPQRYSYLSGTSQATPHVAGLVACARQMFQSKGIVLTRDLIEEICQAYGDHPKNTTSGYGMLHWSWFKRYYEEKIK